MYKSILSIIPTFLFFGYFPKIPGTFGTFGGVLFSIFLVDYLKIDPHAFLFTTIFIIILSVYSSNWAINYFNSNDPKEVVIDEVIGQSVPIYLFEIAHGSEKNFQESILFYIYIFVLFRFFDIKKPFPVNIFDKNYKNSFGVIIDDVIAGLYVVLTLIVFMIIKSRFFV